MREGVNRLKCYSCGHFAEALAVHRPKILFHIFVVRCEFCETTGPMRYTKNEAIDSWVSFQKALKERLDAYKAFPSEESQNDLGHLAITARGMKTTFEELLAKGYILKKNPQRINV